MPDDPEELTPDAPPPPRANRPRDDRRDDRDDDRYRDDDRDRYRDDRDDDYHPRGRYAKYDADGYEITQNDIMWAIFAHIGVFLVGIFAPIIILFAVKSPFVNRHSKESLNHQITLILLELLITGIGAAIGYGVYVATQEVLPAALTFDGVLLLLTLPLGIWNIVCLVMATIAATKAKEYRYPFTLRLIG